MALYVVLRVATRQQRAWDVLPCRGTRKAAWPPTEWDYTHTYIYMTHQWNDLVRRHAKNRYIYHRAALCACVCVCVCTLAYVKCIPRG